MGDFVSSTSLNVAERDDELRRLLLEADALEKKRAAIQERIKLLLGLAPMRRTKSRYSLADLDALARRK